MDVLVLGGTRFLGRAVVAEALRRGDSVTTFTRGISGAPPPQVTALHGDRGEPAALEVLRGRRFDVVIDTSGYVPTVVGAAARLLAETARHYVFVSTINVYPGWPGQPVRADSTVYACPPDVAQAPAELTGAGPYGYLKAGCERAVEEHFPDRCTQIRAGLLIGPYDNSGRLAWWIDRISRGGRVPVPGPPDRHLALIDVRDLAGWMLHCGQAGVAGAYNATAPRDFTTYREMFEAARDATGADAELVWTPEQAILDAEVEPWTELPLWLPSTMEFAWTVDVAPAHAAGLTHRPITETITNTWAWLRTGERADDPALRPTGMSEEQEKALLAAAS